MKIAIPIAGGQLSMHFGHCEEFAIMEVDEKTNTVTKKNLLPAPPHQPGLLPVWLAEKGATVIIAGGMGSRAQDLFTENNIKVVVGVREGTPDEITAAYLNNTLSTGNNVCDH